MQHHPFVKQSHAAEQSGGSVILAGDCSVNHAFLRCELDKVGCHVRIVPDCIEAFASIIAQEFDVLVVDPEASNGAGYHLIDSLPLLPVFSVRPEIIVWTTGTGAVQDWLRFKGVRVAACLHPDDGPERLAACITAVLDDPLQFVIA